MSATKTPGEAVARARIRASSPAVAPSTEPPAPGGPGWVLPSASTAAGPSRLATDVDVAAATQTAAFTARPGGSASSTTTTPLRRGDRVGPRLCPPPGGQPA